MISCYDPECSCRQCDGSDSEPTLDDICVELDIETYSLEDRLLYDLAMLDYELRVLEHQMRVLE